MTTGDPTPVASPDRLPTADGSAPPATGDGASPVHLNGQATAPHPVAAAPEPEPLAPADLVPAPSRRERIVWYAGTMLLAALLVAAGYRLDRADLGAPFYYDLDSLLILPMVKSTVEQGTHWRNERMGYPGVQELHDFPVIDHLHFAIIKIIGLVVTNVFVLYNLYYLLTYPLTALTAMAAFRHLRLTLPAAAVGGILYAFLPYHVLRWEHHYFLSAYWVVPLSCLPVLGLCRGDFPFFRREATRGWKFYPFDWHGAWLIVLAALTASAGAYYAFFACMLYTVAGVYGWVVNRTWKAIAASALLTGAVVTFGILNHLPTFLHVSENGRNSVAQRYAIEADIYGLKIAHLILPVDAHNLTYLGKIKSSYNAFGRPLENENASATLGAVGTIGFLLLVGLLLLPVRKRWPYGALSSLTGFILLMSLVGGFGGVFNLLMFDQIRCYNRISVFLAFFCLFAVLWPVDRFLLMRTGWARRLRYPALVGLTILGITDQTPTPWFQGGIVRLLDAHAQRFRTDQRFFGRIEEIMPEGAKIFNLPYMPYPEEEPLNDMNTYEHARGFLHTRTLLWSYGAMKNRLADRWYESVATGTPDEILRRVVVRGFDGIFIDKRGYPFGSEGDKGEAMIVGIRHWAERNGQLKLPMIVHEDGLQVFLDVRPYRQWLQSQDPHQFAAWERDEREWATITWLYGFMSNQPYGMRDRIRWASTSAIVRIENPSDRPRAFMFAATFGVDSTEGPFRIQIDGGGLAQVNREDGPGLWTDDFTIEREEGDWAQKDYGIRKAYLIQVPPGGHIVRFRCEPPFRYMPDDRRPRCYYLKDIAFFEVK